jgi:DNA-binding transcriptional MerR regulator
MTGARRAGVPPGTRRADARRTRLKMKDLERATGVGREAIRFYIHEGLLPEPEKPARNVAWYDETFVDRIRVIKRLQQERFLPLTVIKGILGERRTRSPEETRILAELDGKISPDTLRRRRRERLRVAARRLSLPIREIRELAQTGFLDIVTRDDDQWLEGNAIALAELWAQARAAGFSKALGFTPADLGLHAEFVHWLVNEEANLFLRRVTGKVEPETARRLAEDGLALATRMLPLLHENALLRLIAGGGEEPPRPQSSRHRPVTSERRKPR